MRHIGSLVAGVVVAPLAWVLIAAGQPRTERTFERWSTAGSVYTGDVLGPLGLVVGAGLLLGLIVALRVSPVGPLVAGAFYLGVYGYALREPMWVVEKLPQFSVNGYRVDTVPPFVNGTMALAGAVLVVAALSRRRWQRWPVAAPAAAAPEASAGPAAAPPAPQETPHEPAGYTPNEVAPGPPPAVGDGPLWPSTVTPDHGAEPTRESMFAGLTPGTPEDLPRRTPPKRPTASEVPPEPTDTPAPEDRPAPVIPSPRHAAPTEGWPLDSWPATNPADRPTIQPTYRVPPENDRPQPTPPSDPPAEPPRPTPPAPLAPQGHQAAPPPNQPAAPPMFSPPSQPAAPPPGAETTRPQSTQPGQPGSSSQAGPADSSAVTDPPMRPINPLAQRPISTPPSGPPRPRPVNPLSPRPPVTPPEEGSDSTQRLPAPAEGDGDGHPADPPNSPWSRPPRPPQDS